MKIILLVITTAFLLIGVWYSIWKIWKKIDLYVFDQKKNYGTVIIPLFCFVCLYLLSLLLKQEEIFYREW